ELADHPPALRGRAVHRRLRHHPRDARARRAGPPAGGEMTRPPLPAAGAGSDGAAGGSGAPRAAQQEVVDVAAASEIEALQAALGAAPALAVDVETNAMY